MEISEAVVHDDGRYHEPVCLGGCLFQIPDRIESLRRTSKYVLGVSRLVLNSLESKSRWEYKNYKRCRAHELESPEAYGGYSSYKIHLVVTE